MQGREQLLVGVVEDSDDDFWVLNRLLRSSCTVQRWTTSEDALEALADDAALARFGALFVDFHLPGLDGVELVRRIRALPAGERLRVIMLSGARSDAVVAQALDAGVDRYEHKPSSLDELRSVIGRSLGPLL
ncbi:MAG: response regulator [Patulibacter minatonensis]